ncbi:hypothetical protein C825_001484 [Parabacteroides sp. ASF519]|nr:hypothetical protein C825_001484 [Parabacteroides sp. ASF519]
MVEGTFLYYNNKIGKMLYIFSHLYKRSFIKEIK